MIAKAEPPAMPGIAPLSEWLPPQGGHEEDKNIGQAP